MPAAIDVFLTCDDRDAALAREVHAAIVGAGMTCWCEVVDLVPGEKWDVVIPARLRAARIVAVLITDHWPLAGEEGSDWYGPDKVALAIDEAQSRPDGPTIVPVWLRGGGKLRTPFGLRRVTAVDLGADPVTHIAVALRRVLGKRDGSGAEAGGSTAPPPVAAPRPHEWLDAPALDRLVDAWIDHPLDRDLLLSWIPRRLVAGLARKSTPFEQIQADLIALNRAPVIDGELPIASWLRQAVRLAGPWPQARTYSAALTAVEAKHSG